MLKEDTHPELEDDVREICKDIVDDPTRSSYISINRAHKELVEKWNDVRSASLKQTLGVVFRDAEFLEEWSGFTYVIIEEEL